MLIGAPDLNKALEIYKDVSENMTIPTVKICHVIDENGGQKVIFMSNAGISFNDFTKKIRGSEITCAIKKNIRNMLRNFIDNMIKLNEKYLHADVKKENIMFKEINGQWTIMLIDLDDICLRENALSRDVPSSINLTTSVEFYIYICRYADFDDDDSPTEFTKKLITENKKINFLGIIHVIIDIIILSDDDITGPIINYNFFLKVKQFPLVLSYPEPYETEIVLGVYIFLFYKYMRLKEFFAAKNDEDKEKIIRETVDEIKKEVNNDKNNSRRLSTSEQFYDLKMRTIHAIKDENKTDDFVKTIYNEFIPRLYNLTDDTDENKYVVDAMIRKNLGNNNPVKKKKINYVMELFGLMYEINLQKRDYDRVKQLIDLIYGIKSV